MSYYRNVYLKSDEWKQLRMLRILQSQEMCMVCGTKGCSLDVHHVKYRNLWDVTPKDLRAVCRVCHDKIHHFLKKYPLLKKQPANRQWFIILSRLRPKSEVRMWKGRPHYVVVERFYRMKKRLFIDGKICRRRMRWSDALLQDGLMNALKTPNSTLSFFIEKTGKDPRRLILDIVRTPKFSKHGVYQS